MFRRIFLPLLLSLMLLIAACSKEKDVLEPAPSLEGTWMQTRLTEHVPCSTCTTQRFFQDVTYSAGEQTLTLTPNEYILRNKAQGTTYTFSYVRRSDTLLITVPLASGPITGRTNIIDLTPRSLHLQQYVPRSGSSAILDQYFTR